MKRSVWSSPTNSGPSSGEELEDEQPRRRAKGKGAAVSGEDAIANFFVWAADRRGTKERKLAVAEMETNSKKQQTSVLIDLVRSTVDSPNTKKTRIAVEKTIAEARLKEVETQAESAKISEAFHVSITTIMSKLADKLALFCARHPNQSVGEGCG